MFVALTRGAQRRELAKFISALPAKTDEQTVAAVPLGHNIQPRFRIRTAANSGKEETADPERTTHSKGESDMVKKIVLWMLNAQPRTATGWHPSPFFPAIGVSLHPSRVSGLEGNPLCPNRPRRTMALKYIAQRALAGSGLRRQNVVFEERPIRQG